MESSRPGPAGTVMAVALLVLVGAVVLQHLRLREVTGRAEAMAGLAGAAELEDRLIGQRLPAFAPSGAAPPIRDPLPTGSAPLARADTPAGDVAGRRGRAAGDRRGESELRMLWIIDLGRCAECLQDLAGWHALGAYRGLERRVILTGAAPELVRRIAGETGLRRHLAGSRTAAAARDLLGREPPASVVLLIDDAGEVLLADARDARTACRTDPMERIDGVLSSLRRDRGVRKPPTGGSPEPRELAAP